MSADHDRTDDRTLVSQARIESLQRDERTAVLELVKGAGAPRTFRLTEPSMLLGREASVDIPIESQELSRRHLRITRVGEEHMCVDQGSVNGVFLNGVKIHSAVLRDGDQLQLADCVLLYRAQA